MAIMQLACFAIAYSAWQQRGARFFTIVCDLDSKSVAWIGDGHSGAVLDEYWNGLTEQELNGIEVIAMDMGRAYYASAIRSVLDGIKKVVSIDSMSCSTRRKLLTGCGEGKT